MSSMEERRWTCILEDDIFWFVHGCRTPGQIW